MNIGIISIYPFPDSWGAATNRITAYAKGLNANGASVDIFIPFPTHNFRPGTSITKTENNGCFKNINYYYTSGKYRHRNKLVRAVSILSKFRKFYGFFTAQREILRKSKTKTYDAIIISTDDITNLFFFSLITKHCKAKSIFIFDEFPTPIRHKLKKKIPVYKIYLYSKVLPLIDAYISISENLSLFYNNICSKPTHILPIIVDTSRFDIDVQSNKVKGEEKYLCYMGNMELAKDDVDNIIRAFSVIASEFEDVNLHLYGGPNNETKEYLNRIIGDLNLEKRCFLSGKITADKVPYVLKNAYVLVSSQPDTVRASGGFPTKLGEYLTTGVPALITDVGENAKYVKDRVHLFFAPPGDAKAYAAKLKMIMSNYSEALKVARQGQKFVFNNFSHIETSRKLLAFISDLNQRVK